MIISAALKERLIAKIGEEATQKIEELKYDRGDYLDIGAGDETKISYIPVNQYEKFAGDFWNRELRKEKGVYIKLSKLLTLAGLDNSVVSALSIKWGNKTELTYREMDITEMYQEADESALNSCMTPYAEEVGEFYSNFNVTGVGFFNNNEMVARALLWKEVFVEGLEEPIPLLDRIYSKSSAGNNLNVQDAAIKIAENNGWAYLTKQAAGVSSFWYKGQKLEGNAYVKANSEIDPDKYFYPYIDTFAFVSHDFTIFSTHGGRYRACSTEGRLEGYNDHYLVCAVCAADVLEEDAIIIDDNVYCSEECAERDGYRYVTFYSPCERRYYDDWVYDLSDYVYIEKLDAYVHYDYATYCDKCDEGVLLDEVIYDKERNNVCPDCFEYYEYKYCEECGEYSEKGKEINGRHFCPECLANISTQEEEIQ